MPENENELVVAVYKTHSDAEEAVRELQTAGFDMRKLSVIGKDYHTEENVIGYYNVGDRMATWGSYGAFWGFIWGLLFGSAFLFVPGIGPIVAAGPFVLSLIAALETAVVVGGLSALGAALYSIGIPKDSILQYETALRANKFLVIAHGTTAEVEQAKTIIDTTKAEESALHNQSTTALPSGSHTSSPVKN